MKKTLITLMITVMSITGYTSIVSASSVGDRYNFTKYVSTKDDSHTNTNNTMQSIDNTSNNITYNNNTINISGNNNVVNISTTNNNYPYTNAYAGGSTISDSNSYSSDNSDNIQVATDEWGIRQRLMKLDILTLNQMFTKVSNPNFAQWQDYKEGLCDLGINMFKNAGLTIQQQNDLIDSIQQK